MACWRQATRWSHHQYFQALYLTKCNANLDHEIYSDEKDGKLKTHNSLTSLTQEIASLKAEIHSLHEIVSTELNYVQMDTGKVHDEFEHGTQINCYLHAGHIAPLGEKLPMNVEAKEQVHDIVMKENCAMQCNASDDLAEVATAKETVPTLSQESASLTTELTGCTELTDNKKLTELTDVCELTGRRKLTDGSELTDVSALTGGKKLTDGPCLKLGVHEDPTNCVKTQIP